MKKRKQRGYTDVESIWRKCFFMWAMADQDLKYNKKGEVVKKLKRIDKKLTKCLRSMDEIREVIKTIDKK